MIENENTKYREIKSLEHFLDFLAGTSNMVIICLKDTAGYWLDTNIQTKLHTLGLKETLVKKLLSGYIAIIDDKKVIYERLGPDNEKISFRTQINEHLIEVVSAPFKNGNLASICIDGAEYAVNDRGLNIVVFEKHSNKIVDSVAFDTHVKEFYCTRIKEHYDIGVVGCWWGTNYGSCLNGYAVYKILKSFGLKIWMINRHDFGARRDTPNVKFARKMYEDDEVSPIIHMEQMNKMNEKCDTFLAGSDQIWKYYLNRLFDLEFMLKFADDSKKKISFGSSFGHAWDSTPKEVLPETYRLMRRFDAISVRENSGVDICREVYGLKAKKVIEPVFCLSIQEYMELAQKAEIEETEPFMLTYILDPTEEIRKAILAYSELLGVKAVNVLDLDYPVYEENKKKLNLENILPQISPEDLMRLYSKCSFVLTDSFHGTAFAIIFNKPFLSVINMKRGAVRFTEMLEKFDLMDHLAQDPASIPIASKYTEDIDYTAVNKMIKDEREEAIAWLKNAIETPKDKLPSIVLSKGKMAEQLYQNPEFIKIRLLATLLRDYGVKHVVLSPGGRDVPLVRMFENNEDSFILHRVTDERSAAYYGMGIAAQLRKPVVCVCTSGTAASNYLPAVTEAYYTGVPLIVVTADRQQIYLNHGEDQTIPQKHIYAGVIKREITLPEGVGYKAEYQTRRDISDCILETTHNGFGPVHINIAISDIGMGEKVFREHWKLLPRIMPHILRVGISDGEAEMMRWVNELKKSAKILVVYGQNPPPTEKQLNNIERFASKYNCVIVTDFISNLDCAYSLKPYNMLRTISNDEFNKHLSPDILITVGGKRLMNDPLTFKVRGGLKNIRHWSVSPDGKVKDFYFRLTSVLEMSQDFFFEWFSTQAGDIINNGVYYNKWREMTEEYAAPEVTQFDSHYIQSRFIPIVPENSLLHLGVGQSFIDSRRYSMRRNVEVFCNMGTNGIDGCTSTFMGQCSVIKDKLCFLLVGDLSFFYDMNSIWNKKPGRNVRILMVNNSGSGLLRNNNLKAVTAAHNTSAQGWVESVNFEYISANTKEEYEEKLKYFVSDEPEKAVFFEVFCN